MQVQLLRNTAAAADYFDPYGALLEEQLESFNQGQLWSDEEWTSRRNLQSAALTQDLPAPQQAAPQQVDDQSHSEARGMITRARAPADLFRRLLGFTSGPPPEIVADT
jgi:ABC-type Fe3+-citrate transport system substrate-binding protein